MRCNHVGCLFWSVINLYIDKWQLSTPKSNEPSWLLYCKSQQSWMTTFICIWKWLFFSLNQFNVIGQSNCLLIYGTIVNSFCFKNRSSKAICNIALFEIVPYQSKFSFRLFLCYIEIIVWFAWTEIDKLPREEYVCYRGSVHLSSCVKSLTQGTFSVRISSQLTAICIKLRKCFQVSYFFLWSLAVHE